MVKSSGSSSVISARVLLTPGLRREILSIKPPFAPEIPVLNDDNQTITLITMMNPELVVVPGSMIHLFYSTVMYPIPSFEGLRLSMHAGIQIIYR